jgi:hypothetical protein
MQQQQKMQQRSLLLQRAMASSSQSHKLYMGSNVIEMGEPMSAVEMSSEQVLTVALGSRPVELDGHATPSNQ